jgi:hypothetical protein
MAPRRRPPEAGQINRVQLRLPTDVFKRIEAKAKRAGRPFHRILVEELSLFPHLYRETRFGELVGDMETVLARYASHLTVTEFNEALLHAVDETLSAGTDGQLQQQLDRLRVIRSTMLEGEWRATPYEDEKVVDRIGLLARQVREMESLPEDIQDPKHLVGLKAELARLQQTVAAEVGEK